jgi:hypothetical protein
MPGGSLSGSSWLVFIPGSRFSVHEPLVEMQGPSIIVCLLCWICTEVLPNVAMHPWSQNCPIKMRDPFLSWGKICALRAAKGRLGMSRRGMCLERIRLPLG